MRGLFYVVLIILIALTIGALYKNNIEKENQVKEEHQFRQEILKELKSLNNNIYRINFVLEKQSIEK